MSNKTAIATLPFWIAMLAYCVHRGVSTGSFSEVSTYIGIVCGVALVFAAWLVGRRRAQREAA